MTVGRSSIFGESVCGSMQFEAYGFGFIKKVAPKDALSETDRNESDRGQLSKRIRNYEQTCGSSQLQQLERESMYKRALVYPQKNKTLSVSFYTLARTYQQLYPGISPANKGWLRDKIISHYQSAIELNSDKNLEQKMKLALFYFHNATSIISY